jgi:hypothetical protein
MTARKRIPKNGLVLPKWSQMKDEILGKLTAMDQAEAVAANRNPAFFSTLDGYAEQYCKAVYKFENIPIQRLTAAEMIEEENQAIATEEIRDPRLVIYRSARETKDQLGTVEKAAAVLIREIMLLGQPGIDAFLGYEAEHASPMVPGRTIHADMYAAIDGVEYIRQAAATLKQQDLGRSDHGRQTDACAVEIADLATTHYAKLTGRAPTYTIRTQDVRQPRRSVLFTEFLTDVYIATGISKRGRRVAHDAKGAVARWKASPAKSGD